MSATLGIVVTAAVALGLAAIVYRLLRHAASTALLLIVPLALAGAAQRFGLVAPLFVESCFVLAVTSALPVAANQLRLICGDTPPRRSLAAALRQSGLLGFLAVAALALPVLVPLRGAGQPMIGDVFATLGAALGFVAAGLSATGLAAFFPYTEEFVAHANRARERRETAMAGMERIAQPRWGFAVLGIAAILATLEGFALRSLDLPAGAAGYFPLAGAVWLLACLSAMRDWRLAAAAAASLALVVGLTLAAWAHAGRRLAAFDILDLGLVWAAGAVALWVLGASWSRWLKRGLEPATALALALREDGPTAFAAALIGALPGLAMLLATLPKPLPAGVAACAFPFAVFPVFPGIGIALYTLFPRYRSVDEVFGKR